MPRSHTFHIRVYARRPTPTGIYLCASDPVKITYATGLWIDSIFACDAAGWDHWMYRPFDMFKYVPGHPFMCLLAQIGSKLLTVGTGRTIRAPETGELILFANDIPWMMWNNRGWIDVHVHVSNI